MPALLIAITWSAIPDGKFKIQNSKKRLYDYRDSGDDCYNPDSGRRLLYRLCDDCRPPEISDRRAEYEEYFEGCPKPCLQPGNRLHGLRLLLRCPRYLPWLGG